MLSSLLIHYMSVLQMSRVVTVKLDQIHRNFLWRGGNLDKKPHLVDWVTVCMSKENEGLVVPQ